MVLNKTRRVFERFSRREVDRETSSPQETVVATVAPPPTEDFPTRKSHSIEAEDLLIESIFLAVLKKYDVGTYLDIGAAHPIEYSNTYLLYQRGWSGICVEPNPEYHALYATMRPRDTALNIGVASTSGKLRYHRFEQPLINGFFGQWLVDAHIGRGEKYLGSSDVACLSVENFLNTKLQGPVDLLNIDVETLDAEILAAWNWHLCRPKVICAEIHTSSIEDMLTSDVARILKQAGYASVSRGWMSTIFVDKDILPAA